MPGEWDPVSVGGEPASGQRTDASTTPGAAAPDPWKPVSVGAAAHDPWAPVAVNGEAVGAKTGFWADFGEGTGGVTGILKAPFTDSIPANIVKGGQRDPVGWAQGNAAGGLPGSIAMMMHDKINDFLSKGDNTPLTQRLRESFGGLVEGAKAHPGVALGSLLKGLVADPELFFAPAGAGVGAASRVEKIATAAGAGEKATKIAGGVAAGTARAGTAAGIGASTEMAGELGEGRDFDPGAIGLSALMATPFAATQVPARGKGPKLNDAEIARFLDPAAKHGDVKPQTVIEPTANGYSLRTAGNADEPVHFATKAEAESAQRELENIGSAYRTMDAVPRGTETPSGQRAAFLHENPFTPEKMKEYVKRPDGDARRTGADLAKFWGKAVGAAAIGAGVGAYLDRDDPALGATFGAAISLVPRALPKDKRISIEDAINTRNGLLASMARRTFQFKSAIDQSVPEPHRRAAISLALEKTPGVTLNATEQGVADSVRNFFDAMGRTAVDAGVLKEMLKDYVSHIVEEDPEKRQPGLVDRLVDVIMNRDSGRQGPTSGKQYAQHRQYATFDELHQALKGSNLKIKTGDIGEIVAIYSKAMFRSITDKRLLDALKGETIKGMTPQLMDAEAQHAAASGAAAIERQPIEGEATPGLPKLQPPGAESAPSSKPMAIDDGPGPGKAGNQGNAVKAPGADAPGAGFQLPDPGPDKPGAAAQKFAARGDRHLIEPADRGDSNYIVLPNRQLSGFVVHKDIAPQLNFIFSAKDPNDVTIGLMALNQASKRSIISFSLFHAKSLSDAFVGAMGVKGIVNAKGLVDSALTTYLKGGSNDGIDALLKNGLQINVPEDASTDAMHGALTKIAGVVDQALPVSAVGTAVKGIAKFSESLDKFTFAYLQTGFKLVTGLDAYERLLTKGMPRDAAARMASSYANDIYGSLDWFRVANDVSSRIGRDVAYGFFNPNGRRWTQLAMFAPDWTFSTFRAAYKALPGAVDDPALAALHRRYLGKSALYYLTVANGINFLTAGHSIFSNENPTRIQLADGRTMQFSKHFMEPAEWLKDPIQTADNKLAFLPRASVMFGTGKEYISAHDAAPDIESRGATLAAMFTPISAQQGLAGGGAASITGLIGMPIYGKDAQQKIEARKLKKKQQEAKKKHAAEYYRRQHQ